MAESRGELDLYNQWFVLADADKDGVVSGPEAVQFFSKSGLPKNPTLFKIWQHVAGDQPSLNRQEFYTAMKLVSLAQANNGVLDDQAAMRMVNGLGGATPPPRLAGLPVPPELLSGTAQAPSPALLPPGSLPAGPGGFVPMAPQQVSSFSLAFQQLDTDGDGLVQGVDCFGVFMRSGLPKQTLKAVWDLVAGEAGSLSNHQFIQALYLIEHAKAGRPLPPALPTGPFPPVVSAVDLASLTAAVQGRQADIFTGGGLAAMPPRAAYDPSSAPAPGAPYVTVPALPAFAAAGLADLSSVERARLDEEQRALRAKRAEAEAAEAARAAAAARAKFYTDALAALRLAGSGIARALVEAQQRQEMEEAAAESAERDYDAAYADFTRKHAAAAPAVAAAQAAAERRTALAARLEALRATVAELESAAEPGARARDEAEAAGMGRELTALTVRKAALEAAVTGSVARRDALVSRRAELKAAADAAQAALGPLQGEVAAIVAAGEPDRAAVVAAMRDIAPLYDTLYRVAREAMLPLPAEALAGLKREALPLTYDGMLAAGAAEWGTFDDRGFTIVSALAPDERLKTLTVTPAAAAAEAERLRAEEAEEDGGDDTTTEKAQAAAGDAVEEREADDVAPRAGPDATASGEGRGDTEGPNSPVPTPDLVRPSAAAAGGEDENEDEEGGILASAIAKALDVMMPSGQGPTPAEPARERAVPEASGDAAVGDQANEAPAPEDARPDGVQDDAAPGPVAEEQPEAAAPEPAGDATSAGWQAF